MDPKLYPLVRSFSDEFIATAPRDLEVLATFYIDRAFEIGRSVGRSEATNHENPDWRPPNEDDGGRGPDV